MLDLKWSPSEKAIARKAYNQAFEREMAGAIAKVKKKADEIKEPDDLWKLQEHLTKLRRQIDEKYDYRYSVLHTVFARLIYEGHLSEAELQGIGEDKMKYIRMCLALWREQD